MKNKLFVRILCLLLICSILPAGAAAVDTQTPDAPAASNPEAAAEQTPDPRLEGCSDWAREEIAKAIELGFVPEELLCDYTSDITRAEFAKVALFFSAMQYRCGIDDFQALYCAFYQNEAASLGAFADCEDPYVTMARATDLVLGIGDNLFDPDRPISREESAKMLVNAFRVYSGNLYWTPPVSTDPNPNPAIPVTFEEAAPLEAADRYLDGSDISDWAKSSVAYLTGWGVMKGIGDGQFGPALHYTREQCFATFVRLYENAPASIGLGAQSLCPYTPETLVGYLEHRPLYQKAELLENEFCYVLCGSFAGTPRGDVPDLYVVYKTGGMRSLFQAVASGAVQALRFGSPADQLEVTTVIEEEAHTVGVDLSTGALYEVG